MSPSDEISDEDFAKSPFHGKATARIAQETGDPLANVDHAVSYTHLTLPTICSV